MNRQEIIRKTESFVQDTLQGSEAGHDWSHIERVVRNARTIAAGEKADPLVIELAALLHDIADSKFHNGNEELGPERSERFLKGLDLPSELVDHVVNIVRNVSFKNELDPSKEDRFDSIELQVLKDADRLDAMGAIGVARAFHYGGYKNRALYDPSIKPVEKQSKEQYKTSKAPTINHFYEKLLLLKDKMNTQTGRKMAEERHAFMESFLDHFYREWEGH
jgi:uncharacterized protein